MAPEVRMKNGFVFIPYCLISSTAKSRTQSGIHASYVGLLTLLLALTR